MPIKAALLATVLSALVGCGDDSGPGADAPAGGGDAAACPNAAGVWQFDYTCPGSAGGFSAPITQTGCAITLVQMDDQTPMSWTSSGELDDRGDFTLSGQFGFTVATSCTGSIVGDQLSLACGGCSVDATRP
jgi:hypothetical protein